MARQSSRKLWSRYLASGGQRAARDAPEVSIGQRFRGTVLGIDPSLRGSGFAVIRCVPNGHPEVLESVTLKMKAAHSFVDCLGAIGNQVDDFLNQHAIDHVAIEETIYVQNFQTAQILGAARGAAIATAAMRGLPVFEYAPLRVKQAVTGAGRASKEQLARTVTGLTGKEFDLRFDESDAAAVALCHLFTWRG